MCIQLESPPPGEHTCKIGCLPSMFIQPEKKEIPILVGTHQNVMLSETSHTITKWHDYVYVRYFEQSKLEKQIKMVAAKCW